MHSSMSLHGDGPNAVSICLLEKELGVGGGKTGFPVAFQHETDSGKSVLYTVSGA